MSASEVMPSLTAAWARPTVSVIVPTLGRPSLRAAVESALHQSVEVEVIVVNDGGAGIPLDLPGDEDPSRGRGSSVQDGSQGDARRVAVFHTSGRAGASAARNLGLAHAVGEFFAFLDDDDTWLPHHLTEAIDTLERHPAASIYACRGLVLDSAGRGRVEPIELLGNRQLADYFFGFDTWRSRCRRVMTPTLVARSALATHRFDETLTLSEDTWWLITAERELGARTVMSPAIGVVVHADPARSLGREAEQDRKAWAERLDTLVPGAGATYIASRGRDAARSGDLRGLRRVARDLRGLRGASRWYPVLAAESVLAVGVRALRRGVGG